MFSCGFSNMFKNIRIYCNIIASEFVHFLAPSSKAFNYIGTKKLHWQSFLYGRPSESISKFFTTGFPLLNIKKGHRYVLWIEKAIGYKTAKSQ